MDGPPKIRLIYFNGRGRAELPRLILSMGKMEYENVRIKEEDWPKMKPTTPYGQLPVLEFDGITLSQSLSISRFLAKRAGLIGDSAMEECQADMVVDSIHDVDNAFYPTVVFEKDPEKKKQAAETFWDGKIVPFIDANEKILKERGGKFFAGNKLSWADIAMLDYLGSLVDPTDPMYTRYLGHLGSKRTDALEGRPLLADLLKRVSQVPGVKQWMEARPGNHEEKF